MDAPAMNRDRARWDARYVSGDRRHDADPVPLLVEWVPRLRAGRALDIAAGLGRHALLLARYGWTVDAVDISLAGLLILKRRAMQAGVHVNLIAADVDHFVVRPATYDLVVQTFFLKRRLLPRLRRWVRPGGYVYVETHLGGPGTPARGRYALRSAELRQFFSAWQILASAEGTRLEGERRIVTAGVLARRPGG